MTVRPQYFDSFIVPFYPSLLVSSDSAPNKCSVIMTLPDLIETFISCFVIRLFFIIQVIHGKYMPPVITSLLAYQFLLKNDDVSAKQHTFNHVRIVMKIHLPTTVFHHSCGRKVLLTIFISSILSVQMFQPLLRLPVLPDKTNHGKIKLHVFKDI